MAKGGLLLQGAVMKSPFLEPLRKGHPLNVTSMAVEWWVYDDGTSK